MKPYKQKTTNHFVAEAPTCYYDGNAAVPLEAMTPVQKMQIVRDGVSKAYLVSLKKETGLDYDALAQALSVTRSTLINKKGTQKFNDNLSGRIVALADLYSFGYSVFEDKERFNRWMFHPNQALGGVLPFDYVDNHYGRQELSGLLGRMAYGVFS